MPPYIPMTKVICHNNQNSQLGLYKILDSHKMISLLGDMPERILDMFFYEKDVSNGMKLAFLPFFSGLKVSTTRLIGAPEK